MKSNLQRSIFRLVAISTIVFTAFSSYSQTHYSSNIALGLRGGMDMSRVFFNPSVKQGFQPGMNFGFTFRYIEENHFGLIAELNYAQRGWNEDFEDTPYYYKATLNYLQLPILAHIYFGKRGKFFFNVGPEFGLFLGEKRETNFSFSEVNNLDDFPPHRTYYQWLRDADQKFDYGITAGLGGEVNINKRNSISLEARFYYGIGNVFKAERQEGFRASNQMTISASIGYWFRIK